MIGVSQKINKNTQQHRLHLELPYNILGLHFHTADQIKLTLLVPISSALVQLPKAEPSSPASATANVLEPSPARASPALKKLLVQS